MAPLEIGGRKMAKSKKVAKGKKLIKAKKLEKKQTLTFSITKHMDSPSPN